MRETAFRCEVGIESVSQLEHWVTNGIQTVAHSSEHVRGAPSPHSSPWLPQHSAFTRSAMLARSAAQPDGPSAAGVVVDIGARS